MEEIKYKQIKPKGAIAGLTRIPVKAITCGGDCCPQAAKTGRNAFGACHSCVELALNYFNL